MSKFIEVHEIKYSHVDYSCYTVKRALNPKYIMEVYLCHQPSGKDSTQIITTEENITVQESYDDVMKMLNGC